MSIQVLSSTTSHISQSINEWKQKLSTSDWKTHVLVVLSYLLIGIGVALACSSFYFATVIHPMIATSLPIGPMTAGIVLRQTFGPEFVEKPFQGHFIGLRNEGANCWIITGFLFLFHSMPTPLFIQRLRQTPIFSPIFRAARKYQKELYSLPETSSIDVQKLRECLHSMNPEISSDVFSQEDPMVLFEAFASETSTFLPLNQKLDNSAYICDPKEFCVSLDLVSSQPNHFMSLFNAFFHEPVNGSSQRIVKWFSSAPREFSIQLKRFGYHKTKAVKYTEPLDIPLYLDLTKDHCPQEPSSYFLDGAIIHLGSTLQNGHYIFLFKKNGRWWKVDDHRVQGIEREVAKEMLKNAYILHYTKEQPVTV